jgi:peptidoglycan/xylan/chitin deacetylase (PgdA/CDA1 family)
MIDLSSRIYRTLFPSVTFSGAGDAVHLTFDDGPHPTTTSIVLDILKQFNLKSTFFLLGRQVERFPELARLIAADGHTIGNHSLSHGNLVFRGGKFVRREITTTNELILQTCGVTPKLFRPPFGFFDLRTLNIVESLGMRLVHWSNDSRDFESQTSDGYISNLIRRIDKGSIVLLHDNDSTAGKIGRILPTMIRGLQNRGLHFSPLD